VIIFRFFHGTTAIKRFAVQGHSERDIDLEGSQSTELIGEDPC
jgi:hypothetical protein